jgi:general secretion pathway protein L
MGDPLIPRDPHLALILGDGKVLLCQGEGAARRTLAELDAASYQALGAIVAGHRDSEPRTRIELPQEWVVSRTLYLPSQARKNLRQVIGYEIDRLTPFKVDQVYFDFRMTEDQGKVGRLTLELALCRKDPVQAWLGRMRDAGAPVDRIVWPQAWPIANLLPGEEGPRRRVRLIGLENLLFLLVMGLAAAALVGPLWQKSQILAGLEEELSDLKGRAAEVEGLRAAIETAHQGSVTVLERKSGQAAMIDLLRELTVRLPDGTWVENLEFQGQEVQIRGESTQAAALIGLLEQAPLFSGVTFRSPVSQVPNTDRERFHIGFNYQRQGGDL